MSVFDSDPSIGGPSFEELNLYNELVLHSGELAEALQSHYPISTDRSYRVSDPLLMEQLTITDTIGQLGHILPDEQPLDVSIHCTIHASDGIQHGQTRIHLNYSDETFFISSDGEAHYLVADTSPEREGVEPYMMIDPRITSDLIAKLTVPFAAPELCDFTDINGVARINEICASLESSDFVDGSVEHTYALPGNFTVITETKKESLIGHQIPISIEITEDRGDKTDPLTLSTEFTDYRSALGMLRILESGSEEVTLDVDHMRHFRSVVLNLLKIVQPDSVSIEDYREEDAYIDPYGD